ncbi:MAG TPA: hypothetical protein VH301_08695 [Usitatibacter sp.]|jgi:hypothetical protein|nr:hypothetical protein [Usitatibacter sp.]
MKTAPAFLASLLGLATLGGCYYGPYPYGYAPTTVMQPASFDRSWNAANQALVDQGVQVTSSDRSTGTIQGSRSGVPVSARVLSQADGSVRVEFNAKSPTDPELMSRISRSYDARMGR